VRWDLNVTTIPTPVVTGPSNFAGTFGPITDPVAPAVTPTVYTAVVGGVGTYLWDLDLSTTIAHTACGDLDITLMSPAGTTVTITTDNGGVNDNNFNGSLWDAQANDPPMDHVYVNGVAVNPISPEGSLDAFRGQDPNGVWTLTITDDTPGADYGSNNGWSLGVSTLAAGPTLVSTTTSQSPGLAILDVATVSDVMPIAASCPRSPRSSCTSRSCTPSQPTSTSR
jgi:subtilisin-like proprotein convertase family protein